MISRANDHNEDFSVLIAAVEVALTMIMLLMFAWYPQEIGVYANRLLGTSKYAVGARDRDMEYHAGAPDDYYAWKNEKK